MKKTIILSIALACLVSGCNGQNPSVEQCKEHLKKSRSSLNSYYTDKNQKMLVEALNESEQSQNCPETRKGAVEIKISILALQKEYNRASIFIESLTTSDFTKSYKKNMQSNFFKALDSESKSDLKNRNLFFHKAANEVENFISKQKTTDQEAYYDLFLIKSKMLNKEEFNSYINETIKKNPSEKQFFEVIRQSFDEQPQQINASPK